MSKHFIDHNERKHNRRAKRVPYETMRQYAAERKYKKLLKNQKKNQKRSRKIWSFKIGKDKTKIKNRIIRLEPRIGHTPRKRKVIR